MISVSLFLYLCFIFLLLIFFNLQCFIHVSIYVPFVFLDLRLIRLLITLGFPLIPLLSQLLPRSFHFHYFIVFYMSLHSCIGTFFGHDYLLQVPSFSLLTLSFFRPSNAVPYRLLQPLNFPFLAPWWDPKNDHCRNCQLYNGYILVTLWLHMVTLMVTYWLHW